MDTTGILRFLRYLISPEDTILTRPEAMGRGKGLAAAFKSLLCAAAAIGLGMALSLLG
jgi:hypothetical protein